MNHLIFKIETAQSPQQRLTLLKELELYLESDASVKHKRFLKSLLYHRDWYIRQEAAQMIDRYGVALTEPEQVQYFYALQVFDRLVRLAQQHPNIRTLLFEGCLDPSPRFRQRLFQHLRQLKTESEAEKTLLCYAAADYQQLMERGCETDQREAVLTCLQHGMAAENNPDYHRRQCAFALEQLHALENASATVSEWLRDKKPANTGVGNISDETLDLTLTPLKKFLKMLQEKGLLVNNKRVFPQLHLSPATGRISYRKPGLQTWTKQKRDELIQPAEGFTWLKYDYRCMEPTLLLHFLLERFLISLEDIPEDDLYLAINPQNRTAAKLWLNGVINGGGKRFSEMLNPLQMSLLDAIKALRQELLQNIYLNGHITTIGGQVCSLTPEVDNLGGKALNRLIQGSASDIFNHAVMQIQQRLLRENLPGQVGFLLFDEVWIEAQTSRVETISQIAGEELLAVNDHFGLLFPLSVSFEHGSS